MVKTMTKATYSVDGDNGCVFEIKQSVGQDGYDLVLDGLYLKSYKVMQEAVKDILAHPLWKGVK